MPGCTMQTHNQYLHVCHGETMVCSYICLYESVMQMTTNAYCDRIANELMCLPRHKDTNCGYIRTKYRTIDY